MVVGRDMRVSSPLLASALIEGIRDAGADVVDIGMVSTDALSFAVGKYRLPGRGDGHRLAQPTRIQRLQDLLARKRERFRSMRVSTKSGITSSTATFRRSNRRPSEGASSSVTSWTTTRRTC